MCRDREVKLFFKYLVFQSILIFLFGVFFHYILATHKTETIIEHPCFA